MNNTEPVFIRHSANDEADLVHEVHIGRLIEVRRPSAVMTPAEQQVVTSVNARLAEMRLERELKAREALGHGLVIGALGMFLCAMIAASLVWVWA